MADFRQHEGWCPDGASPDGRRRLDVFPDWGDPLPVWGRGSGRGDLRLSRRLRHDLHEWNREWAARADNADSYSDVASEAWVRRGDEIGARLAAETSAVVVVLGPERLGRPTNCPHCGLDRADSDD